MNMRNSFRVCRRATSSGLLSTSKSVRRRFVVPSQQGELESPRSQLSIPRIRTRGYATNYHHVYQPRPVDNHPPESMEGHDLDVGIISAKVRKFQKEGVRFRIFHGSTNSTRNYSSSLQPDQLDVSSLKRVLHVDAATRTALVEPNVPMDRLVEETMKHGLVPPVVMEFPGITVGGGYAGTAGESSSFKYGFFDRTTNWVEIVLADGEVVRCSKDENADLYYGAAGAAGTLGVTTLVELQLKEAKQFVETTYHPVSSVAEATYELRRLMNDPEVEYLDGILFSKTKGVIIAGKLTDTPDEDVPRPTFSNPSDPWFFMHCEQVSDRNPTSPTTEAIPLAEYLFRYDRGGFWVGLSAFKYFNFPFNDYTRWFLDDFLHTRMLYSALHASKQSKQYVVQDLAIPFGAAEEFIDFTDEGFGIWPLWLCPLKQSPKPTMHPHNYNEVEADGKTLKHMLNVGLWGQGPRSYDDFVRLNRSLEAKLKELGGMKWLYAHSYQSEDEFWTDFDREEYERLREKYRATTLPTLHEKVFVNVAREKGLDQEWSSWLLQQWPVGGIWALRKAIESGTYLIPKNSTWRMRR